MFSPTSISWKLDEKEHKLLITVMFPNPEIKRPKPNDKVLHSYFFFPTVYVSFTGRDERPTRSPLLENVFLRFPSLAEETLYSWLVEEVKRSFGSDEVKITVEQPMVRKDLVDYFPVDFLEFSIRTYLRVIFNPPISGRQYLEGIKTLRSKGLHSYLLLIHGLTETVRKRVTGNDNSLVTTNILPTGNDIRELRVLLYLPSLLNKLVVGKRVGFTYHLPVNEEIWNEVKSIFENLSKVKSKRERVIQLNTVLSLLFSNRNIVRVEHIPNMIETWGIEENLEILTGEKYDTMSGLVSLLRFCSTGSA